MSRTNKLQAALLALLIWAANDVRAERWVPVGCSDRPAEVAALRAERGLGELVAESARYRRTIERSRPGEPLFVPYPFPKITEQVLVDLEHAFRGLAERAPMLEADRALVRDLVSGHLRAEVELVENWEPTRCLSHRPTEIYYLVRLREPGGQERARVAMKDSGVLASWALYDRPPSEILELAKLGDLLEGLGVELPIQAAQYVQTEGLPVRCITQAPCIAFRSKGSTYLLTSGPVLYRVDDAGRRSIPGEARLLRERGPVLGSDERETSWVYVGFERRRALRVAGPTEDR